MSLKISDKLLPTLCAKQAQKTRQRERQVVGARQLLLYINLTSHRGRTNKRGSQLFRVRQLLLYINHQSSSSSSSIIIIIFIIMTIKTIIILQFCTYFSQAQQISFSPRDHYFSSLQVVIPVSSIQYPVSSIQYPVTSIQYPGVVTDLNK